MKAIKICRTTADMMRVRRSYAPDTRIGFVPTMGALHKGHSELLNRARAENDVVVLSIFVNPTQFNNKSDFELYPHTWDEDIKVATMAGVDYVFAPTYDDIYADNYKYMVMETVDSKDLCGADRPGHFDGVLTIVLKLLNIVSPQNAYFGEKDFQQLSLIDGMVKAFYMPINIVPVPTVREDNGLALSSRNHRLTTEGRKIAPKLFHIMNASETPLDAKIALESEGFKVDYVVDKAGRRFAAVRTDKTKDGEDVRLIDNVAL